MSTVQVEINTLKPVGCAEAKKICSISLELGIYRGQESTNSHISRYSGGKIINEKSATFPEEYISQAVL
jgi:hypothetical protein